MKFSKLSNVHFMSSWRYWFHIQYQSTISWSLKETDPILNIKIAFHVFEAIDPIFKIFKKRQTDQAPPFQKNKCRFLEFWEFEQ